MAASREDNSNKYSKITTSLQMLHQILFCFIEMCVYLQPPFLEVMESVLPLSGMKGDCGPKRREDRTPTEMQTTAVFQSLRA